MTILFFHFNNELLIHHIVIKWHINDHKLSFSFFGHKCSTSHNDVTKYNNIYKSQKKRNYKARHLL